MSSETKKHKTIGVSLHPELRERAGERALQLRASFSRYIAHCIELELRANAIEDRQPDARSLLELDSNTAFKNDIKDILYAHGFSPEAEIFLNPITAHFLLKLPSLKTKTETISIAIQCKHNLKNHHTINLGEAILLQNIKGIDAILLCIPYKCKMSVHIHEAFRRQGICVLTPDTIIENLEPLIAKLGGALPAKPPKPPKP